MTSSLSSQASELTRRERRRRRNREALLSAARRVMADVGFEHATINAITAEADLGFGTFYQYFQSKEDVLEAVIGEACEDMQARLQAEGVADLPPAAALRAVAARFAQVSAANRDVLGIVFRHGPENLRPLRRFRALLVEQLEAVIRRGVVGGEFAVAEPAMAARALAGLYVQGLLWRGERRGGDGQAGDAVGALTLLAVDGLRGNRG